MAALLRELYYHGIEMRISPMERVPGIIVTFDKTGIHYEYYITFEEMTALTINIDQILKIKLEDFLKECEKFKEGRNERTTKDDYM